MTLLAALFAPPSGHAAPKSDGSWENQLPATERVSHEPRRGGAGVDSVVTAIANKQSVVKNDVARIQWIQGFVDKWQKIVADDKERMVWSGQFYIPYCRSPGNTCEADAHNLSESQNVLQNAQAQLQTDDQQLAQLQAILLQLEATAQNQQALGGGGLDPFASKENGAKVVGVNMAPAPEDIAKLTGTEAGGPASAVPAGTPADYGAASMVSPSFSRRADPGPDFMNARVAIPSDPAGSSASAGRPWSSASDLLRSATGKLAMGNFQGGLNDTLAAIKADPNNPLGYLRAAEAYNKLGRYAEAEAMARKAIALDPKNPQSWKNLAWALLKQGKYKEALSAALEGARLKPDMAEAWAIAAYAAEKLGDKTARNEYLKRAAALDARYQAKLDAALAGKNVYDDGVSLDDGGMRGAPRVPWGGLGGAAAILVLLGVAAAWQVRRRGAASRRQPAPPTVPDDSQGLANAIGKYRLSMVIGRGGMGEVFLGTDTLLGRQVAVKRMTRTLSEAGPRARELFMREARTVAQLHHPSIVDIYDIVEHLGDVYLVFELVRGKTVQQLLAESGKIPLKRASEILKPVGEALDYAHGLALVHRDLKPANIMATDQGRIKLMDFGVARSLATAGARRTTASPDERTPGLFARTMHAVGTPAYMAPEAETGVICKEGDVWSLGVTFHEMLTGQLPFDPLAETVEKSSERFKPASALVPGLPPAVDTVIARALKSSARERFHSAGEFIEALEAAAERS